MKMSYLGVNDNLIGKRAHYCFAENTKRAKKIASENQNNLEVFDDGGFEVSFDKDNIRTDESIFIIYEYQDRKENTRFIVAETMNRENLIKNSI